MPNVPPFVADIFAVAGSECVTASDCEALYPLDFNATTSEWDCVSVGNVSFCQFDECSLDADCGPNEQCFHINQCDVDGDECYDEELMTYSTVCAANTLCDDIKVEGDWSNGTMCYLGASGDSTFFSMEEPVICRLSSITTWR